MYTPPPLPPQQQPHSPYYAPQAVPARKKSSLWLWLAVLFVAFLCLVAGGCFFALKGLANIETGSLNTKSNLFREIVESHGHSGEKVAIIDVQGVIDGEQKWNGYSMADEIIQQLRQAKEDSKVKAVVLRVNSPGGSVTASDAIYHEILAFRESCHKPVVVFMDEVAASGGYYISCAADKIIASPTAITGSIGVIISSVEVSELMGKIGAKPQVFTSGQFKDILSPMREMRAEEKQYVQGMVMEAYNRFLGIVSDSRNLNKEALRIGNADGRILSGEVAKKEGLVDATGYFEEAISEAQKRANCTDPTIIRYRQQHSLGDFFGAMSESSASQNRRIELGISSQLMPKIRSGIPYYLAPSVYSQEK